MPLNLKKIQIFLILASDANFNEKLQSFMGLIGTENNKVSRETSAEHLQLSFELCSPSMIYHMLREYCPHYFSPLSLEKISKLIPRLTFKVIDLIFKEESKIYDVQFRDRISENYQWILSPHEVCVRIFRNADVRLNRAIFEIIENNFHNRSLWIKQYELAK